MDWVSCHFPIGVDFVVVVCFVCCFFSTSHADPQNKYQGPYETKTVTATETSCRSNRFWLAKQQLCTCITLFCTFLFLPCTTTKWNDKILSVFWGRERQGDKFYHLCLNSGVAPLFSSNINFPLLSNWATRDNGEMVWKDAAAYLSGTLLWKSPLSDRKVPIEPLGAAT